MIPLVINKPELMLKVKILAIKDDRERTLKALQKVGVVHIEASQELAPVEKNIIEKEKERVSSLLSYVNTMTSYAGETYSVSLTEDIEVIYDRTLKELGEEIESVYNGVENLCERIITPAENLAKLEEMVYYLTPLSYTLNLRISDFYFTGRYLFSRIVVLKADIYQNYKDKIEELFMESVMEVVGDESIIYGIGKIEKLICLESLIKEMKGKYISPPKGDLSVGEFLKETKDEIIALRGELLSLQAELHVKAKNNLNRLTLMMGVLMAEQERLSVLEKAAESKHLIMFTGWIPEDCRENAISDLKSTVSNIYVDLSRPLKGEEPPTMLNNRGSFKPFEIIVNLFGTPKYREWDPTPIITYSFALFFGLMIGDVIYSIGIALLAKFLLPKFTDDPNADTFKMFQRLIYISSGVGMVVGLLTGGYLGDVYLLFGIENFALSPAIRDLLGDPVTFIVIALVIGLIHVNLSYFLAFLKAYKENNRWGFINKIGIFLLQFGLPGILNSILGVDIPGFNESTYSILNYVMLAGIGLIIVSNIGISRGLGTFMWVFDLTGLLGDVMSYARLAGVGMATFYLASTFNMLVGTFGDMFNGPVGAIFGFIIGLLFFIFGHAVNLLLGGITGFIHSLRLCFVEFLFKFYEGGGYKYDPFKIQKRTAVHIKALPVVPSI